MDNKITIIGSGIIGLSAAYFIHKKNYNNITVIDRQPHPAGECTFQNGCQLSYSDVGPISSLGNILKGISWLGKEDAPLLIRPSFKNGQLPWLFKYAINALPYKKRQNIKEILKLGFETKELFKEEKFPFDFEFKQSGIYHIFKNVKDLEKFKNYSKNAGVNYESLNKSEFYEYNKSVKKDIAGSIYHPQDEIGNSRVFCTELKSLLQKKGVKFVFDAEYKITKPNNNEKIIIAAGANSYNLAKQLRLRLPIYPTKGYSITVPIKDENCISGSLMDEDTKIVYTRLGNRLRAAGTGEFNGFNYDITPSRIKLLKQQTLKLFPQLESNINESEEWACLRPFTPNGQPIIKQLQEDTYICSGNGFLGWTQSLATGKRISEIIE